MHNRCIYRICIDCYEFLFLEYLYRVMASGEGGWTAGPWQRGRSRETGRIMSILRAIRAHVNHNKRPKSVNMIIVYEFLC